MNFDFNFPMSVAIGSYTILFHSIFELLATFIAFRYYQILRKKNGDTVDGFNRLVALVGATAGALLGSHLLGACENIPQWVESPNKLFYLWTNKTMTGGLLGGLISVEIFKKFVGENKSTGDLFTFPLILGIIIGRIGCFSVGIYEETYGLPSTLPLAMNLGDQIDRHPVTLYEILFLIFLWIILKQIKKKYVLRSGMLFKLFMLAYFSFRFLLDFIKPGWRFWGEISSIQIVSLCTIIYDITAIYKSSDTALKKIN